MEQRQERILIETPRHRIAGTLTLARDGYRSRVSDLLNASERDFIALTDVTVEAMAADGVGTHHDFMAVSRQHIIFAIAMGPVESAPDDADVSEGSPQRPG